MEIRTWDQAETALAQAWPSFKARPQQRVLAHGVTQTVHGNSRHPVLFAQAGCGVGKSLGYSIPAIAWALSHGKRVVISVSTKALQDQLIHKDLPTLQKLLFPDLTFASLKGRSNYACLRAADKAGRTVQMRPGGTGERADLASPVTDEVWREVTVDSEGCIGRKACPFSDECFSESAKERALSASVLVVNTSLLTQHLRLKAMTGGKALLLGGFNVLVVDEAHEMADIVASGLSTQVTLRRISECVGKLTYHLDGRDVPSWVEQVNDRSSRYFNGLQAWFKQQKDTTRTADLSDDDYKSVLGVIEALSPLADKVRRAECSCEPVFDEETGEQDLKCEFARRTSSLMNDLTLFTETMSSDSVQWVERGQRDRVELKASPAEVGGWLRTVLWEPKQDREEPKKVVLTSATLGIGGDFTYIARRLGVPGYDDLDVGSPFDFKKQTRLYLPPMSAPSPKQRDQWLPWARLQMAHLVEASDGDALLLFTSTSAMREAHNALSSTFRRHDMTVLLQGDGVDNRTLAEMYANTPRAVLFATRSFMTGVDFPGKKLVVMDKLPFPVPEDPVFKARCKAVEDRFGERSSFRKVSIPEMSLVLVQGGGRLIRTVTDRGVFAILDSRTRAGWASPIRASLPFPKSVTVSTLEEVEDFYSGLRASSF